ncbi:MAG: recombinase RecT [Ginsengibacter sp.]
METNNKVEKKSSKMEVLKKTLDAPSVQDQFKNALDDNTGTFVASLIDLFGSDSYLQNCEPKDVVMEALKAAVLKLPIIKSLGFAYIVPFKVNNVMKPQFQIGYKGLIQLAMRTAQYRIINADVVYEGEYKTKNKLTGEYDLNGEQQSDKVIGYFAHFEMLNGFSKTLYMTKEKVTSHAEKYSKSYNQPYGPWKKEFDAMAIKTVCRGLLGKWGYLSVEMVNALGEDTDTDVADKVHDQIQMNGNRKVMSFENVEEVEQVHEFENAGGPDF